jgi:hypothetical protein
MKNIHTTAYFILLVIGLGFLFWSVFPNGIVRESYTINPDLVLLEKVPRCDRFDQLLASEFILEYPQSVGYSGSGKVVVTIQHAIETSTVKKESNEPSDCTVALEIEIETQKLLIEPGNKIRALFNGVSAQEFRFQLSPLAHERVKGIIWIYSIISQEKVNPSMRTPLFAIPFEIRVKSLFGIAPSLIKTISQTLGIAAGIMLLLNNKRT